MLKASPAVEPAKATRIKSKLLIPGQFFSVTPELARRVGMEKAIILQHIHFLLEQPRSGRIIDGYKWVWNTYEEWRAEFRDMWATKTLADHLRGLEAKGALITMRRQQEGGVVVKYYRINDEWLDSEDENMPERLTETLPPLTGDGRFYTTYQKWYVH